MMLPQGYGMPQKAIRKGQLNGTILDSIAQAQQAIDNYEKQSKELERTQKQIQTLTGIAIVVFGLGGSYLFYKFLKEMGKTQ
jgi:glucose-6-phosphate isomerase